MTVLSALLLTAAVIGGAASVRVHGAYRESLRELRDSERRLEAGSGGRRLEDELRWYADVATATRDTGWRVAAGAVAVLTGAGLVLGIWTLTATDGYGAAEVIAVLVALLLVLGLAVADGRRADARSAAAVRWSPLGAVRRLEDALVAVHTAAARGRRAHRTWLRTRSATYPAASLAARGRERAYRRASARRDRSGAALRRAVPVDLSAVAVRLPDGYADGLRGLAPLVSGAVTDDDSWAAAVADLSRAAELDTPRRTRWLSALAACAELRDDPPARESAARWALEAAALGEPAGPGGPRTDPLPDAVAIEPTRAVTWEGALRRARTVGAAPALLAEVTLRWAYALADADLDPAVDAAAGIMTDLDPAEADRYLTAVRPGLELLGASSPQLSRLVPHWTCTPDPEPASATRAPLPPGATRTEPGDGPTAPVPPGDATRSPYPGQNPARPDRPGSWQPGVAPPSNGQPGSGPLREDPPDLPTPRPPVP